MPPDLDEGELGGDLVWFSNDTSQVAEYFVFRAVDADGENRSFIENINVTVGTNEIVVAVDTVIKPYSHLVA